MLYSLENKTLWETPKPKRIIEIWVDAGFAWSKNLKSQKKEGIVAFKTGNKPIKEKLIRVKEIKGLKQYSNLMELIAVLEALKSTKAKNILIRTDSQIARSWTLRKTNDLDQFSEQHFATKEKINNLIRKLKYFDIVWISRNDNPVGIWLEERYSL